jgi:isopenicillin N synthase-like dioxygenase
MSAPPISADGPIIPVIDISSFLAGSDLVTAPAQVDEAATRSGFFQIVGHGIDTELLDAVYRQARLLADEPPETRAGLLSPVGHPYRGLTSVRDSRGVICSQRYHASHFDDFDDAVAHGVPAEFADFFSPNVWPDLPGFRDDVLALFTRTQALSAQLMRLFAVALGLPIEYFDPLVEPNSSSCSINYYPPRHEPLVENPTVIFDEHFDGGTLTVLHQRGTYEGLQIRTLTGEWFAVPVVPEAFVVNMGELMTRWTNDRWPATRHRVIASTDPEGYRTTLTTFHLPAVDAVIGPLPVHDGLSDPHYEPVTPYEWERRFIKKVNQERTHTVNDESTDAYIAGLT